MVTSSQVTSAFPGWGMAGGMCGGGACMVGSVHGRGHAWKGVAGGVHGGGGMHGRGHVWQGGMRGRGCAWRGGGHAWQERWSLQRTVRILLECILVPYVTERYFPRVSKFFPVPAKFPVFSLSGKSKHQNSLFPCFPYAMATRGFRQKKLPNRSNRLAPPSEILDLPQLHCKKIRSNCRRRIYLTTIVKDA